MSSPPKAVMVKPSYDPGWNDPPMMDYTSAPTSTTAKPKLLNKRIAFPMQSANTVPASKVQTSDAGLPMPFARVNQQPLPPVAVGPDPQPLFSRPQLPPPLDGVAPQSASGARKPSVSVDYALSAESSEQLHSETLIRLRAALEKCSFLDASRLEELHKRLELLSLAWSAGEHLDARLQHRLKDISLAIESERTADATDLHRSLVVDYGTVSAPWASALRQIILAKQPLPDVIAESDIIGPTAGALLLDTASLSDSGPVDFVPGRVQHL